MKTLAIIFLLLGTSAFLKAQTRNIAHGELKTLDGISVSSAEILNPKAPTVIVFWKSGSSKSCDNLEELQASWLDNMQQRGVKMLAICIDGNGSWNHIKPMANGRSWEFEILIDPNCDFKRAMNISNTPTTMLYDQNQQLVCRQLGYFAGNEELICEKAIHSIENTTQYANAK